MARRTPVAPADIAARLSRQVDQHAGTWLVGDASASAADVSVPLHPPKIPTSSTDAESGAAFIRTWQATEQTWRKAGLSAEIHRRERNWRSWGVQTVPERVQITGADSICAAAGRRPEWRQWVSHRDALISAITESRGPEANSEEPLRSAMAATWKRWARLSDGEIEKLGAVVAWFLENPNSGLLPRAVAVRGVDGKWLEKHNSVVRRLVSGARGDESGGAGDLGLNRRPAMIRLRLLDPRLGPGWPSTDVSAPVTDLAGLWSTADRTDVGIVKQEPDRPHTAIIVENLETFISLPTGEFGGGAVAVWGAGYGATELARLRWLRECRVLYWGDLDAHGFGILNGLRGSDENLDVTSVLMDRGTFEAYADLAVRDPSATRASFIHLTAEEADALDALVVAGDKRLEQERIPWPEALRALRAAARRG
ncbi:hypothetical protein CJ204_11540 [Corynebacterium xerosis]|uniref:DUF3322 and DUF2220 domain-containing protein n=1 Tax=Corynebacterium xerosis TaxID=1725 RepID=A0A2N6SWB6_9CORY|nr:Wadjet anti-phage system protein JetD domain-containing protein [Corynebacterium xerosis]PMC61365.1 hypothetical protein CJ204_11540 [Corynebacterium xerosis]